MTEQHTHSLTNHHMGDCAPAPVALLFDNPFDITTAAAIILALILIPIAQQKVATAALRPISFLVVVATLFPFTFALLASPELGSVYTYLYTLSADSAPVVHACIGVLAPAAFSLGLGLLFLIFGSLGAVYSAFGDGCKIRTHLVIFPSPHQPTHQPLSNPRYTYTTPHHTTPHHTSPHHPTPPTHTTPRHTTPHHSTPHHHTTPHHITPHHTKPHHTKPHHTTPHPPEPALAQHTSPHSIPPIASDPTSRAPGLSLGVAAGGSLTMLGFGLGLGWYILPLVLGIFFYWCGHPSNFVT